ncbi:MAG: NifB/NifX family molybdenum-iron cluster-binding protein [Lachnospiraceae bacterium]
MVKIAVASSDGKAVDRHFGRADVFHIVEVEGKGSQFEYIEQRSVVPVCINGSHNQQSLYQIVEALSDCQYVLVSKIGYLAEIILAEKGIDVFEIPGDIRESIDKLFGYIEIHKLVEQ